MLRNQLSSHPSDSLNLSSTHETEPVFLQIPMRWVGPIKIVGDTLFNSFVPLATYESPLWPSVQRGANIARHAGGITTYLISSTMTRSVLLQAVDYASARDFTLQVEKMETFLQDITAETSSYCKFQSLQTEIMGKRIWIRFSFSTGKASGHNMVTKASSLLAQRLAQRFHLQVVSDSGNFCVDKKVSSANPLFGRGCHVQAHLPLSQKLCKKFFKCDLQTIKNLCLDKNWYGSHLAGSLHSSNAHFANMLLAFYLATGQDGANIVEGSQGQSWFDDDGDNGLIFSCRLPHLIVGSIGNGKHFPGAANHLESLKDEEGNLTKERLAQIAAATVLCGELSLLGALCRPGELMRVHEKLERSSHLQENLDG